MMIEYIHAVAIAMQSCCITLNVITTLENTDDPGQHAIEGTIKWLCLMWSWFCMLPRRSSLD